MIHVKRIILTLLLLTMFPLVSAFEDNDLIISQETLDNINFNTLDLDYTYQQIYLSIDKEQWRLWTKVYYLNTYPINETHYEVQYTSREYSYTGFDFFNCLIEGNNDVSCFNAYVLDGWTNEFTINDFLQRSYLKSLQTNGSPILSNDLRDSLL